MPRWTTRWSRQLEELSAVAALIGPRQAHGALKILWFVEFHINADRLRETAGEELSLLKRHETPHVRDRAWNSWYVAMVAENNKRTNSARCFVRSGGLKR